MKNEENIIISCINKTIKILIDNGHGYNTPGKRSPYSANNIKPEIDFYEYLWNREIGKNIMKGLIDRGYNSELIVTEDDDISLSERVRRVNNICDIYGNDNVLLISIHSNACGNGSKWENGKGWEAYTSKGNTKSDLLADIFYKNANKYFPNKKIRTDLSDGDMDKEYDFTIIKNTKCPSILTENFFYDNIEEVKFILSDEGKKLITQMHIDSIIEYIENATN